jgi:hypothetical protein
MRSIGRLTAVPLISGIAQKAHGRRQPSAILRYALGPWTATRLTPRSWVFARPQPPHQIDDVHPAPRADHAVKLRDLAGQILTVALRQAPGGDQVLIRSFERGQLTQGREAFLAGWLDETAGVDDQHFGAAGVVGAAQPGLVQQGGHRLRVDRVLGAAEAEQKIGVLAVGHAGLRLDWLVTDDTHRFYHAT